MNIRNFLKVAYWILSKLSTLDSSSYLLPLFFFHLIQSFHISLISLHLLFFSLPMKLTNYEWLLCILLPSSTRPIYDKLYCVHSHPTFPPLSISQLTSVITLTFTSLILLPMTLAYSLTLCLFFLSLASPQIFYIIWTHSLPYSHDLQTLLFFNDFLNPHHPHLSFLCRFPFSQIFHPCLPL